MWTVIYMAKSKEIAEQVHKLLDEKNILVKIRPLGDKDNEHCCYEILVPESEISQAHSLIIDSEF